MLYTTDYNTFVTRATTLINDNDSNLSTNPKIKSKALYIYLERVEKTKLGSELQPNKMHTVNEIYLNVQTSIGLDQNLWFKGYISTVPIGEGLDTHAEAGLNTLLRRIGTDFAETTYTFNLALIQHGDLPQMVVIGQEKTNEDAPMDGSS